MPSRILYLFASLSFAAAAGAQNVPRSSHVWMITEENHSYQDVVGNAQMPYYNQLIRQYGMAAQFYSDQHSSLPALMWLVAGAAVEPNNDTTSCDHPQDNVVRELLARGYTWRAYQENLPNPGYQGLYSPDNLYYRRHNPLIDFSDVCPGTGQDTNSVPYTQMAADFAQGNTVNYAYITPNVNDDAHNGTLQQADQWLQANVPAILARPEFSPGGDGILLIVWDEGDDADNSCSATVSQGCGGRTPILIIGPGVKAGYQSNITYHNENVLATICAAMGLAPCPGAAQNAAPMSDFFGDPASDDPADGIATAHPLNGETVVGAVHLMATASENQPVSQTQVWDNGTKLGVYGTQIDQTYNLTPGTHTTTVEDLNPSFGQIHSTAVTYNVQPLVNGVQIITPIPDQTINMSTVHIVAHANESVPVNQMQVWDNGVKLGWFSGADVNNYFALQPGTHTVTVEDINNNDDVMHQSTVTYNVQGAGYGVQVLSPAPNQAISPSKVQIVADASEAVHINQMQVWDNGVKLGWYPGADVIQSYTLAPGLHTVTVEDLDSNNNRLHQTAVTYTVNGVQVTSPTPNQTIGTSTVQIAAHATEAVPISQMQVWDNGVRLGWYPGASVNQSFTLAPGIHTVTILDLDSSYNIIHFTDVSYSVQ